MFKEKLDEFLNKNPEVEVIILAAGDGLPIEVAARGNEEAEELAARVMALVSSALSYQFSPLNSIVLNTGERKIFVTPVNDEVFLVAMSRGGYDGKINFYMKLLASEIEL